MSPDGSIKPPPPEERLLRLIRGKGTKPADGSGSSQGAAGGSSLDAATVRGGAAGWPKLAVGMLAALIGIEVLALIIQAIRPLPPVAMPALPAPVLNPAAGGTPRPVDLPSLASSASRPIFTPPTVSSTEPSMRGSLSGSAKLLSSRLTLMGIVAGNPAQAIIEDSQTKKTYFVTTGQAVVDDAVLEQVLDNRVILDLRGEKIELTL